MPEYLAPGVYVEEVDTGNKPIEGVSTSTAGMLGVTERGPVNIPILVTSYGEYTHWFGGRLNKTDFSNGSDAHCYLPHAVEGFFTNNGKRVFITRVLDTVGAVYASTFLFDRGTSSSASTILLRTASQSTGTAANPPPLYVMDGSSLHTNDWIRIGDGSNAEYRRVESVAAGTTHVALDTPLSRSHSTGDTIEDFAVANDVGAGNTFTSAFVVANTQDTQRGESTFVITGATADISALAGNLLEIGNSNQAEYRFAMSVTNVTTLGGGQSQANIQLDSSLMIHHKAGSTGVTVTPLKMSSFLVTGTLNLDAAAGDRLVFTNTPFTNYHHLVVINRSDTTAHEVRKIGELDRLLLEHPTTEMYPAGSIVEVVTMNDDMRTISTIVNTSTVTLNDASSLVKGQKVLVDPGANQESSIILSISATSNQITFTAPLTKTHTAPFPLVPLAKTMTAAAAPAAIVIALNDRLGLSENDVLRIGAAPDEEFDSIKLIPNNTPDVPPDAGNVILTNSLDPSTANHGKGTKVWRQTSPALDLAHQTTVLALDIPIVADELLVTDGQGFPASGILRITTPSNEVSYLRLAGAAPVTTVTPDEVTFSTTPPTPELAGLFNPLERAHGAGSVVVGRNPLLQIRALDAGAWGNRLRISIEDEPTGLISKTTIATIINPTHIRLASAAGVEAGTILDLLDPLNNNTVVGDPLKVQHIDRRSNYTIILEGAGLSALQQTHQAAAMAAGKSLGVQSQEFRMTVQLLRQPDPAMPSRDTTIIDTEVFRYLSMDPRHSRYIQTVIGDINGPIRLSDNRPEGESGYVRVHDRAQNLAEPNRTTALESVRLGPEALVDILPTGQERPATQALENGDDSISTLADLNYIGTDDPNPANRTGLFTFASVDDISLIAAPGRTSALMQAALIDQCELLRYRFAVLDGPPPPDDALSDVQTQRQQFDTKYAAMYYPWLLIPDPFPANLNNITNFPIPPSGHVIGVYARTDDDRGVHKAPANEVVQGIIGLQRALNKSEQDILNPYPVNINVIRDFRPNDRGLRVFGARVITSDTDWKYVNVRRLLIFLEASIDRGLQWVVFEPNAEALWARVRRTIANFLTVVWRNGALEGTKPEEAFFVKCDRTTMTQTDIDNGRLICLIGVAPVKPAEYVIIRIGLFTANANT